MISNNLKTEFSYEERQASMIKLLCSYCSDYLMLNKLTNSNDNKEPIARESSTDGITTGIVLDVVFDEFKKCFVVTVLSEGKIHSTIADGPTEETLLLAKECDSHNPCKWCRDYIYAFEFMHLKPFVLRITNGEIHLFEPISPSAYEIALDLAYEMFEGIV